MYIKFLILEWLFLVRERDGLLWCTQKHLEKKNVKVEHFGDITFKTGHMFLKISILIKKLKSHIK